MKRIALLGWTLAVLCGVASLAHAQAADDYPQRNVTFLCPFPPGGGTDLLTRLLAQELQDKLKKPVIVENRPGGGGNVGAGVEAVVISGANAAEALVPGLLSREPAQRATQALPTHAAA